MNRFGKGGQAFYKEGLNAGGSVLLSAIAIAFGGLTYAINDRTGRAGIRQKADHGV